MSASKFVHVFNTWEVYPRVYYFQKRYKDVHSRFINIMSKGPYASLLVHSLLFDKLKDLRCMLENCFEVCVFGRENIDQKSLVVTEEPLRRSSQNITLLGQEKSFEATSIKPVMRVAIASAEITNFGHEGLNEVVDCLSNLISDLGKSLTDLGDSVLIVCHTDVLHQAQDVETFRSCVIKMLNEHFGLYLSADNVIIGKVSETLSSKVSLMIETRIINGFFIMREHLQSFFGKSRSISVGQIDIVESQQLLNTMQEFLKDGFRLVEILEDSHMTGEPFVENVLRKLTRNIRCAIIDPLSSKLNLKPDLINHFAHELIFEEQMNKTISKNTRYHLGKLQQPCEEMAKALKENKKCNRFLRKKFIFIAYSLREDIRPIVLKFEEGLAPFRRKIATMKKMIFEIDGNIQQSIVKTADFKKITRNRSLTDEIRKSILSVKGVYGTGTVFGELEVHVETNEAKQHVLELMEQYRIRNPVYLRKIVITPNVLAGNQVEHGWILESKWPCEEMRFKAGTLGGFVDSTNGELYALTCAHVVYNNDTEEHMVYMKNGSNDREPFATSYPNLMIHTGREQCPLIDIAAVKVLDEVVPYCTKYFKDDNGMLKSAELENETTAGQYIYKYGAASGFTSGMVCCDDYTLANGEDEYLVLISPPAGSPENERYALPGDSGSINCIPDVESNKAVKVVSMLSAGHMKLEDLDESVCLSFLVGKGLEQLRNITDGIELTLPSMNNTSSSYRSLFF